MSDVVQGWHFLPSDCRLGYGDNRLVVVGDTLTVDCEPILCKSGLHASRRIIDALAYAQSSMCSFVEVVGEIVEGDDKLVGSSRKTLWMHDISELLHHFACDVAESVLLRRRECNDEPDKRSWAAIEAKRKWINGEISDSELAAASDAAMDVARAAAYAAASAAARAAAWAAAWAAARAATSAAASAAALDVAMAATSAAAWDVAWDKQNAELERRVRSLMESS